MYPDTAGDTSALSAEEWFGGKNAEPVLVSLRDGYTSTKKSDLKVAAPGGKRNVLDKLGKHSSSSTNINHRSVDDSDSCAPPAPSPAALSVCTQSHSIFFVVDCIDSQQTERLFKL